MEAEIVGEPQPKVTWYKDGIELQTTERRKFVNENRKAILILIEITEQDAGEYVLKVENEMGQITCRTTLIIKGMSFLLDSFKKVSDMNFYILNVLCIIKIG